MNLPAYSYGHRPKCPIDMGKNQGVGSLSS
jgi:hypothetical protein